MSGAVEIDTKPGRRVRVACSGERVELRELSRLSASSGIYSPTKDGFSVPRSAVPALIRALQEVGGG